MTKHETSFSYRLGIDVGVASIGIAILQLNDPAGGDENDFTAIGGTVRLFSLPEGAEERRSKRSMRRNNEREKKRLDRLGDLLSRHGLGRPRKRMEKRLLDQSPIKLRAKASREEIEPDELARALLHMARHRGSSAFRESLIKDKDEKRISAIGIDNLRSEMKSKGFTTYGQYLRWREKQTPTLPTRINPSKTRNEKGDYVFYPSREMLMEEFEIIWREQQSHHKALLTAELKKQVSDELFFQRRVTSPPAGNCPYHPDETRLPRASRLFQERRIYEEANHLRFFTKNGEPIPYGLDGRDKIVARLMRGDDLSFAELKKTVGLKGTDKVSLENAATRREIKGYPFDRILGAREAMGDVWNGASPERRDEILHILATEHDLETAKHALSELLPGCGEEIGGAVNASLPSGWGRMGKTATEDILAELRGEVVPARVAEERAGLVHDMEGDGVIYDSLPYYGEILKGHTVEPIWASDYRRATDRPPNTHPDEQRHGRIPNPVVHVALNQIREVVNAVIRRYGLPESIHIELARDLNKSAKARKEIELANKRNRKQNEKIAGILKDLGIRADRRNIQKYQMWKRQGGKCMYTLKPVSLSQLYGSEVNVDHILPKKATFQDNLSNKLICLHYVNADKAKRCPYEAFAHNPKYDWPAIMRHVKNLPKNMHWRFQADAMDRFLKDKDFRARYGTDNAYIARLARRYLACLYGGRQEKVVAVSSHIVSLLRYKWGLQGILGSKKDGRKARGDHRHHFMDALVTAAATRSIIQRIQTEAARTEKQGLETFVERIEPPFGDRQAFFDHVREAVMERVTISRKSEHSKLGQLHQDILWGIDGDPDGKGYFVCRLSKPLSDYATLAELNKASIKKTLPDCPSINRARQDLERIRDSIKRLGPRAEKELKRQRQQGIAAGKKGKAVLSKDIYARAVELHKKNGGKAEFVLYERKKLVNLRRSGNRVTGGYVSGRNHRKDFYIDAKGKLRWQLISMMDANDARFVPEAEKDGNRLLWSAHKDDMLEMDDPEGSGRRVRVVVAKLSEDKIGVLAQTDARASDGAGEEKRQLWEYGLSYFYKRGARRIVPDPLGGVRFRFPSLPRSGREQASS